MQSGLGEVAAAHCLQPILQFSQWQAALLCPYNRSRWSLCMGHGISVSMVFLLLVPTDNDLCRVGGKGQVSHAVVNDRGGDLCRDVGCSALPVVAWGQQEGCSAAG